jgi:acetylornithine deacetylase
MSFDDSRLRPVIDSLLPQAEKLLHQLIACPSVPGREMEVMVLLEKAFSDLNCNIERVQMDETLKEDPEYSSPLDDLTYTGRYNLRVERPGSLSGRSVLFNAHTDVVPPSPDMDNPWSGRTEDGFVLGRGACDDKGQLALLYLLFSVLNELNPGALPSLTIHFVVEEENGGNGTLAMVRRGEKADACIVLEPSGGNIQTSIRGAVWFRFIFHGTACHSGQSGPSGSALLLARRAMTILEDYHHQLLEQSRECSLFQNYSNPMPLNFGRLEAGNWPATVPSQALLEGVLGFLPNRTREQVAMEMQQALLKEGLGEEQFDLTFLYRHDCSVIDPEHPLPQGLLRSAQSAVIPCRITAMTASCDAWFYSGLLNIPTVVFGAGELKWAHTKDERIALKDLADTAEVLARYVLQDASPGS